MTTRKITADEQARFDRIVIPGGHWLAEARASEFHAVSCGDLESAGKYRQAHEQAVVGLRHVLDEWRTAKRYPNAQRAVRRLLESYA